MEHFDKTLHSHLKLNGCDAQVYAFASVLTISASDPPLKDVILLWDFLLAFGVHLNILVILARVKSQREKLLKSFAPMKILMALPKIPIRDVKEEVLKLCKKCPEELYDLLVRHTFDPAVFDTIMEI